MKVNYVWIWLAGALSLRLANGAAVSAANRAGHAARVESRQSAIACSANDATYSAETMPEGTYTDWGALGLDDVTSGQQFITIVNLTPHRFKLTSSHSYQMDTFDWGDIPSGRARQNIAHYTERVGANQVDTNGEAYYSIEGTSKNFVVRATTHIPDRYPRRTIFDLTGMSLGQREYLDPRAEVPVTLVITGSDSHGFMASLSHGKGNWMKQLYDVIKDRPIQHMVMPGTHDSGMSTISGKIVSIGSAANTQTQALNIYNQLRAGARWFDLRIVSVHQSDESDYAFWVAHVNDETANVPIGNTGESLSDIISEINRFTSENPGEIIFFKLRYLIGIKRIPSGPIYWDNTLANNFFTELKKINNRCGNLDTNTQFQDQRASYFMNQNNGAGCVLVLLNGGNLREGVPRSSVADGLYPDSVMAVNDHWSDLSTTQPVAEDQIATWSAIDRVSPFTNDKFLISQWLVSADALQTTALTIQNIAIMPTNPALYWAGVNAMSPTKWPNVLLVDYIGVVVTDQHSWNQLSAELYTLAIGLNLYMLSENCDVSSNRSPLLPSVSTAKIALERVAPAWNGIIFANGTVVDHPPRNLHLGRAEVLKNGTLFNNGTVLEQDISNPY
ncbi:phosphatidylinositol-specific phospholipase C domain-containing protein [Aspergillus undulatus]|uniref:phosphatidylinositol-specific phospholipase C domain-containing protein n=1 Tax=Aspergillus undulatus TaxID=1810928 RepID=UPI003CCD47DA